MSAALLHDRRKVNYTCGTSAFSACDEAASVVTARFDRGTTTRCLRGAARLVLKALLNMIDDVGSYQFKSKLGAQVWNVERWETCAKMLSGFRCFPLTFSETERTPQAED